MNCLLPAWAIGGMILRSNGGIHWPHNAPALGNAGPLKRRKEKESIRRKKNNIQFDRCLKDAN